MGRVFFTESPANDRSVFSTTSWLSIQSGFHDSIGCAVIQVANPSLSQMSSHHAIVTRSPNHWCAISCAMVSATPCFAPTDAVLSSISSALLTPDPFTVTHGCAGAGQKAQGALNQVLPHASSGALWKIAHVSVSHTLQLVGHCESVQSTDR